MREHLIPFHFHRLSLGTLCERGDCRDRYAFEFALARERAFDTRGVGAEIGASMQMNDVVKVARTLAFGERSHLLGEDFVERIAEHVHAICRRVRIGVVNIPSHWFEHEQLVYRQVKLDARRVSRPRVRAAVAHTPLGSRPTTAVQVHLEATRFPRKVDPALLVHPLRDFVERAREEVALQLRLVEHGEIEILGKAIGFEVALLQASSALEDPLFAQRRVHANRCEQPSENVVLLDHLNVELEFARELAHFHGCVTEGVECRTPPEQARLDIEALTQMFLASR